MKDDYDRDGVRRGLQSEEYGLFTLVCIVVLIVALLL